MHIGLMLYPFCCIVINHITNLTLIPHTKNTTLPHHATSPSYLSAWTLMGHEYMELRNSAAAVQCYRNAVNISEVRESVDGGGWEWKLRGECTLMGVLVVLCLRFCRYVERA